MGRSAHSGAVSSRDRRMRSAAAICATAAMLSGCFVHRHPEQMAPSRSPERDSLLQVDAHRADSPPSASLFSADAVYLRAGAPIEVGRANVLSLVVAAT